MSGPVFIRPWISISKKGFLNSRKRCCARCSGYPIAETQRFSSVHLILLRVHLYCDVTIGMTWGGYIGIALLGI